MAKRIIEPGAALSECWDSGTPLRRAPGTTATKGPSLSGLDVRLDLNPLGEQPGHKKKPYEPLHVSGDENGGSHFRLQGKAQRVDAHKEGN